MGEPRGFRKLRVWQTADDLAFRLCPLAGTFSGAYRWLAPQVVRAAVSIPSNIAEGYARASRREYLHHLSIARGSLAETDYLTHFLHRSGVLSTEQYKELDEIMVRAGSQLYSLIRALSMKLEAEGRVQQAYRLKEEPDFEYGDAYEDE